MGFRGSILDLGFQFYLFQWDPLEKLFSAGIWRVLWFSSPWKLFTGFHSIAVFLPLQRFDQ